RPRASRRGKIQQGDRARPRPRRRNGKGPHGGPIPKPGREIAYRSCSGRRPTVGFRAESSASGRAPSRQSMSREKNASGTNASDATRRGNGRAKTPSPASARILVVEDQGSIREYIRTILANAGHEVAVAANGAEAV